MKAAVYEGRKTLNVKDIDQPHVLAEREILLKPLYCGICGTDLHEYRDGPNSTLREPHPYTGARIPQILGHEFSGKVLRVGDEVSNVEVGDIVSVQPLIMPQDDYYSRRGLHNMSPMLATIGLQTKWGGMAEYAVVNDYNVYKIPAGLDPKLGALVEPAAVALNGVERAGITGGNSVFVSGAGPIGALVVLTCAAFGATSIFVSEPNAVRRRQIEELGVGAIVADPLNDDLEGVIRAETEGGIGVDAAIECSGTAAGLTACVNSVRNYGTVSQVGIQTKRVEVDLQQWTAKGLTFKGVYGYPITYWPRIMDMAIRGILPVGKIITKEVLLDDVVQEGFEPLCDPNHQEMKVLVKI